MLPGVDAVCGREDKRKVVSEMDQWGWTMGANTLGRASCCNASAFATYVTPLIVNKTTLVI